MSENNTNIQSLVDNWETLYEMAFKATFLQLVTSNPEAENDHEA